MSSSQKLSSTMQEKIKSLYDGGHSQRGIARLLNLHHSTVAKYLPENYSIPDDDGTADVISNLGRKVERLSKTNNELRSQIKKINSRGYGYDDFLDELEKFVQAEKLAPLTYYPTQIRKARKLSPVPAIDTGHAEIAALALSDWHLSERVSLADSNGINEYNSLIAANRLWAIVQKFKNIIQIHCAAYKIKSIWLPVLGDLISGSIHPEFIRTNDMTDQASQILCIRLLEMVILELKALDVSIQLDAVVGNHPRTTAKVPTKQIAHTNLEWVSYMATALLFRNDAQVQFNVHTSQIAAVELFEHRYLVEHGIDWKNGHEEELEDKLRALLDDPIYRKATGLKGAAFDQVVIGNLHKPAFLERTVKNGSLIGQNELGQQWRLKPIKAAQLMWGISRSHVRTFQYDLDVTDVKSSAVSNPFSEFTAEFLKNNGQ